MKMQMDVPIVRNRRIRGEYYQVDMQAMQMVPYIQPGQFVHLQMPEFKHRILRRPFSVYDADTESGHLRIIYKIVGEGTAHLSTLVPDVIVNLIGPLGKGFTVPPADTHLTIVAGGYGCAATYLLAKQCPGPKSVLIGGRSREDLLLIDEFRSLGAEVQVATEDGSAGHRGLVTDLLSDQLNRSGGSRAVAACGPNAMLAAVSRIVLAAGLDAEISLDHAMCCGVGACFACVVKIRADGPDGWEYARTCREGPVFLASQAVWDTD